MHNYKHVHRISAAFAFLISLFFYLKTIAPTVSFWDCGEFITCSYILGIPHPPGAPFYLLLGRIFTMIPFAADIALRVNVISALSTAFTILLTYLIIVRLIKQWRGEPKNWEDALILTASGFVGALAFAFTETLWFNAVEAEVYAISMLITAAIVYLILVWLEKADQIGAEKYLFLIAYVVGLAIGVHLQMILALPAIFMIAYFKQLDIKGEKTNFKNIAAFSLITVAIFVALYPGVVQYIPLIAGKFGFWALAVILLGLAAGAYYAVTNKRKVLSLILMSSLLVLVGYSTYTMIYIRSNLDPEIDENDPETMDQMISYLNREQYGSWSTFPRRFPGLPDVWQFEAQYPNRSYASYKLGKQLDFMWNYQITKMYLRYFGWQFIGKGTHLGADDFIKENFSLNGLLGLPFLLGMIGMVHHYYRHWRHALSITALFILTGLAIVIYLNQEDPQPRERDYVFVGSFFAFALWIGMGVSAILEWVQESAKSPQIRKLFFIGFVILFTLMGPLNLLAFNLHSSDRTGDYVAYDYSYNILASCEPDAVLFTNGDNDTFPLWFLQYVYGIRKDVRVVNLSLLNTSWYIKQLKHEEPKVPISLSDDEIDRISLRRWNKQTIRIPVTEQAYQRAILDLEPEKINLLPEAAPEYISVEILPTLAGQALRVQDLMILNIIGANQWRKPINFAVTVSNTNMINLDKYLRMDGLSFKLVPFAGENLAVEKLETNLFDEFQYRRLNDTSVYFNTNIKGLLQNYRAAFINLAREYLLQKNYAEMTKVLDKMNEVMPFQIIPLPNERLALNIGQWYSIAGENERAIYYAKYAHEMVPNDPLVNGTLVSFLSEAGKHDEAVKLLEEWLQKNPADPQARTKLEQEKLFAGQKDSAAADTVSSN